MGRRLSFGIALLAACRVLGAQGPGPVQPPEAQGELPVYIEEFFLSEAVRNEAKGELQFTLGGMSSRGHGSAADGNSAGLEIEYGLSRRWQLGLELPYGLRATTTSEIPARWSSAGVNVVYQILRGKGLALAVGAGINLPFNGRGETSVEPELLAARLFGKTEVHASFLPEIGEDDDAFEYNVAAVRPAGRHWFPVLEWNGRRNAGVNSFYVTPGLYRHFPHRLEAGVGVPAGAGGRSSPIGVVVKATIEFGDTDD